MMRAALVTWLLSAVICMGRGDHHHHVDPGTNVNNQQQTDLNNSANSVSLVNSANKEFAFRVYKLLAAEAGSEGNTFFSPASVSLALAALSVGARGQTHQQLFNGLGYNNSALTQSVVDQAYQTLLTKQNSATSEGTAVFVDDKFKAQPEFLNVLKQSYLADGFTVDFTKREESADTINKYVADKTNGKIDKLVEGLDATTVMYLISYIYFKGMWKTPFDPSQTKQEMFHVDANTEVPVQMMSMEDSFDVYQDIDASTTVLHLPFNGTNSMLLLLPNNSSMLSGLETVLCPHHVTKWLKWMKPRMYEIHVPKFSIKTSYSLKDMLITMGMTDMFGAQADLSGISETANLAVSEVVHQASLDVDESGATAAAATGIGIMLTSLRIVPVLRFDRPFMVVIIDRATGNINFLGKIVNPNK
ncbi:serpin A3-5-like [Genypterus blacodes]|uniref:serpin A3-5-like n=1 Tax=Genypterus blacodes TaxID=154954 RepID=UPI003F76EE72